MVAADVRRRRSVRFCEKSASSRRRLPGLTQFPNTLLDLAPPIGAEVDRVSESLDGNPGTLSACGPNGQRLNVGPDYLCRSARVGWLAFCSGPCLKRPGRLIFPPSD